MVWPRGDFRIRRRLSQHVNDNPYAPPKAQVGVSAAEVLQDASPYVRLYSRNQVALAALLGTPLAGGWLMAINYRHVARWDIGGSVLGRSIGLSLLALVIAHFFGLWLLVMAAGLVSAVGYRLWANAQFSAVLQRHEEAGGELYPWWRVAGIGVLCLAMNFVVLYFLGALLPSVG